jgi:signal transduction histidine kinase
LLEERASFAERRRRLEQVRGLAAILRVVAHELRNPLSKIVVHTAAATRLVEAGRCAEARTELAELTGEARRLSTLVDEYLERGRADQVNLELRSIDLREPVRRAVTSNLATAAGGIATVRVRLPETPVVIHGDPDKLAELVNNLLVNAAEALHQGGAIDVELAEDHEHAILTVRDGGPGFADPSAAFRPFYTTKPERTGLGLSIVHDVVRAHRGEVTAENQERGGAAVRVRVPLSTKPWPASL